MAPGWRRGGASCCGPLVSRSPTPAAGGGARWGSHGVTQRPVAPSDWRLCPCPRCPLCPGCVADPPSRTPSPVPDGRLQASVSPTSTEKPAGPRGQDTSPRGPQSKARPGPLPPPPCCSALCVCVVGGGGGLRPALGSLDLRSSSPERPQRPKPLPLHGALGKTFKRQTRVTSAVIPLKHSGPGVCPHWPRAPTRRPPGTASKSEPRPL